MQTKAQKRAWYERNKERVNAARRALTGDRRERVKAVQRASHARRSPERKAHWKAYMYSYGLNRRFKISLAKWLAIFKLQGECCACCKTTTPGGKNRWHTDHDHETGAIRGILCRMCNAVLGMLGDNLHRVEESTSRFTGYLKAAEPVYDANGRLMIWEPKAA